MEKFLRYAVVLFAGALTILFLYPFKEMRFGGFSPAGFYSPIDRTIASAIFLSASDSADYWAKDFQYRNECTNSRDPMDCRHSLVRNNYKMLRDIREFNTQKYKNSMPEFKHSVNAFFECAREDPLGCFKERRRILDLGEPIYEEYMLKQKMIISIGTWLVNIIVGALIVLLIFSRKSLAKFIARTLRSSKNSIEDTAKKIHEKI